MLDAATGTILHSAALGGHPGAIAVDPDRGRVVVSTVTATQERVAVFDVRDGRLLHTLVPFAGNLSARRDKLSR